MHPDSAPATVTVETAIPAAPPGLLQLFLAFAKISLSGFGGGLVFARRAIVEKYRWMSADEFNKTYALCHFLPGPNICNLSVVFGARIRGIPGSFAAFSGLVGPPVIIVSMLGMIYARYGEIPALQRTLAGVSCAAVGLVIGVAGRMMWPLFKRRVPFALGFLVAIFAAIGLLRWPLVPVLLVAIPLSIAVTWTMRKDAAA